MEIVNFEDLGDTKVLSTKYPIIKHGAFFRTSTANHHSFILDGLL